MNREIDINKFNKSITFQNRGIGFTQIGIADEILDLINDLQQENKQLKEEIENIKDFNNKLQASKDRLDKDDYNLAHILSELEEWLKEAIEEPFDIDRTDCWNRKDTLEEVKLEIDELKKKYKC